MNPDTINISIPEEGVTAIRRESLERAIELGANQKLIDRLVKVSRLRRDSTTVRLPKGRYNHCSRAKGWARCGTGAGARWGQDTDAGWEVGPGRWVVCSSDGFSRQEKTTWTVSHIRVGTETWTIAE